MIEAKLLADSMSPCRKRLTTYVCKYPRVIHSEILTHKALSRSSASSRAIPVPKMLEGIVSDPFVPVYIGHNQKGMQPGEELKNHDRQQAVREWLAARDLAVEQARALHSLGVHKGVVNRVTEPWMWITVVISMTEDSNFFGLRDHEAAEPHFQDLARKMRAARDASTPRLLKAGEWHLPFWADCGGQPDDEAQLDAYMSKNYFNPKSEAAPAEKEMLRVKISVGRTARVSYLTHDGRRDLNEDIALYDKLVVQQPLHASPAEHIAQAMDYPVWYKRWVGLQAEPRSLDEIIASVAHTRETEDINGYAEPSRYRMIHETLLGQMRSGNFWGFRQYRKTLKNENIGGPAL